MRIAVIGAGHAGVEAALAVRAAGAEAVVFSAESLPPYFRPRLVAVACGQAEPDAIRMHPLTWYDAKGIQVHLGAPVTLFEPATRRIVSRIADEVFDGVVMACGAMPVEPRIDGHHERMPVFTLWSLEDALELRRLIHPGARLTVIGGGVIGLEAALRAVEAGAEVSLIEKLPRLMCGNLGAMAGTALLHGVVSQGVRVHCGRGVGNLDETANGITLRMDDGSAVHADAVLLSMGARPNGVLPRAAGLAMDRGVLANNELQTAFPGVFVAGDVAQPGRFPRCSVREAAAQGRVAGANAVAAASGQPLQSYVSPVPVLRLKAAAVEVSVAGVQAGPDDREERLDDGTAPGVYRGLVWRGDAVVGVQMVGSHEGFDEWAARVVTV